MNNYKDIEKYLGQKATGYALNGIRKELQSPGKIRNKNELKTLLVLMARCFGQLGNDDMKQACQILNKDITSSDAFFQLGFRLTEAQYPDIAAGILSYAVEQIPGDLRILYELVAALEIQGLYESALKYLKASGSQEFTATYLLAFNTLMTGDISGSEKIYSTLKADSASSQYMVNRLHRVFARVKAVEGVTTLNKSDHRGWHFILTGGLLLHLPDPTKHPYGQYESLEDSVSLCKEGIYRLCSVFDLWKIKIPRILSFDNPESHRLGLAFSETLGIPEKTVVIPEEAGLFVIYDHSNMIREVMDIISVHKKNLQVYCHASQFNREYKVAPDFTNLMYSSIVSPWDRHTIFPTRPGLPTEAPNESDQELASEIVAGDMDKNNLEDMKKLLDLAAAAKAHSASFMAVGSAREKQWYGRKY